MTDDLRVRASAIVDVLPSGMFRVTVTGLPPYDEQRVYTLSAESDNQAAMTGLRYFENAMQPLPGNED